jgi:hypothetical protein
MAEFLKRAAFPNQFWVYVLEDWSVFAECHLPKQWDDSPKNTLWYNHRIKIGNGAIFYRHWYVKMLVLLLGCTSKCPSSIVHAKSFKNPL